MATGDYPEADSTVVVARRAARHPVTQALETGRNRLLVTGAMMTLAFLIISVRLLDATVLTSGAEPRSAVVTDGQPRAFGRSDIVDRNGRLLATSLATASLYADAKLVIDPAEAARKLVQALPDLDYQDILTKLSSGKRFIWLRRHLMPAQHGQIHNLGVPGIAFQREERRFYPTGPLAAHVVGFTGVDNNGLGGIELGQDKELRSRPEPLALSIDLRVQHKLKQVLADQIAAFNAIGGNGIIMDVRTFEVLAMVSLPDFDPHSPAGNEDDAMFNRNIVGVYEMGSTFKIFNTAMALDSGTVGLNDTFDARHGIRVGRFTISDYHGKNRFLTTTEIFKYSSNIGSVKMALHLGTAAQRAFMKKMGFDLPVPFELPEAATARPLVPNPWREINTMTIAFGHGLSVSPLHLVTAVAAVANGGIMRRPTLIRREPGVEIPGERVISERTSDSMRALMRLVVTEGTATKADAPGYLVGGKTGTADKQKGRHYTRNSRLSSFVGVFPINAPRLAVLVMIDEPKGNRSSHGYATGGWVAAPAVARIVKEIGPMLGIEPVQETPPAGASASLGTGQRPVTRSFAAVQAHDD